MIFNLCRLPNDSYSWQEKFPPEVIVVSSGWHFSNCIQKPFICFECSSWSTKSERNLKDFPKIEEIIDEFNIYEIWLSFHVLSVTLAPPLQALGLPIDQSHNKNYPKWGQLENSKLFFFFYEIWLSFHVLSVKLAPPLRALGLPIDQSRNKNYPKWGPLEKFKLFFFLV